MSINIDEAQHDFGLATVNYDEEEKRRQLAALRLIVAHALDVAPEATHMLMESSDQGDYVTVPSFLQKDGVNIAEAEWDERVKSEDEGLDSAPGWLPCAEGMTFWEQYIDRTHPFTNINAGYYAVDLRRVAADAPAKIHTVPCRAHAIGCAVQNLGTVFAALSPVDVGDSYLTDDSVNCLCASDESYLLQVAHWITLGVIALNKR